MYDIRFTSQFKKDFKLCVKRGLDINEFTKVLELLKNGDLLSDKYHDHLLQSSKDYKNCRELHIEPDWLLIYKYEDTDLVLYLIRTGSHSDLF